MLNIKTVVVTKFTVTVNMTQKAVQLLERDYKNSFEGDTKLSHERSFSSGSQTVHIFPLIFSVDILRNFKLNMVSVMTA